MYDIGFWTRFMYQNHLKNNLAAPMIRLIKNTLDKNRVWLRIQENYK